MRIAHLSDTHISAVGETVNGIDTRLRLTQALAQIGRMEPLPDLLLITGDLVDAPTEGSFNAFKSALDGFPVPVLVIPGNHDGRAAFLSALGGSPYCPVDQGYVQYVVDGYPVRLIALDSVKEGSEQPKFCEQRAQWLEKTLAAEPDRPTLLFIHHPPVPVGSSFIDFVTPSDWAMQLRHVIEQHRQIELLVCGHAHSYVSGRFGHVPISVAPSTAFQIGSVPGVDEAPWIIDQTGDILIHYWTGDGFLTRAHDPLADPNQKLDRLTGRDWEDVKAALGRSDIAVD